MWLPSPVYERIPQFWLLLGLLFMTSGTYLGFEYQLSFLYFGVGFFCVARSLVIFVKRLNYRSRSVRKPIKHITTKSQDIPATQDSRPDNQPHEQLTEQPAQQPGQAA